MQTKHLIRVILLGSAIMVFSAENALADNFPFLACGTRVRATVKEIPSGEADYTKHITGTVVRQDKTTITLNTGKSNDPLVIPQDNIELLEKSVQTSNRGQSTALGLGVGVAVGVLAGFASGNDSGGIVSFSAEEKAGMGAITFGLAGALIGAIAGSGEKWEEVSRSPIQLGLFGGARKETGIFFSARF